MNSNLIQIAGFKSNKASKETSLFTEMEELGIDPAPLLEIAAHDLLNQYGNDAVSYSIQIERGFEDNGDTESAAIWQKISHYLQSLNGSGELVAH